MSSAWTVRCEGLSKKFGLSLRQAMHYGMQDSMRKLVGMGVDTGHLRKGEFWAVKDTSFELHRGESLGIMGVNGSGKTTLLRILNGIYAPDAGQALMRGRIGALIAAGAGFAPMLTGRENVFVNGTLLGMTPAVIRSRMNEIMAFAELEEFIDMPVKHYSSGMFVRLGFAIAAMSEPDILLVDEVLAVGDLNFQKKCFDYLFQLKRKGTSIVLVSHSIGAIWTVCDKGLFMEKGEAQYHDSVEDLIRAYDEENARKAIASSQAVDDARRLSIAVGEVDKESGGIANEYGHQRGGTGDAIVTAVRIFDSDSTGQRDELEFGEPFTVEMDITAKNPIVWPLLRITIDAMHYRYVCVLDSYEQGMDLPVLEAGEFRLKIKVPFQNFRPGGYKINCAIVGRFSGVHIFYWFNAASFLVRHPKANLLYADDHAVVHLNADFRITS